MLLRRLYPTDPARPPPAPRADCSIRRTPRRPRRRRPRLPTARQPRAARASATLASNPRTRHRGPNAKLHQALRSADGVTREEALGAHEAKTDVGAGMAPDIGLPVERKMLAAGGDGRPRATGDSHDPQGRAAETQRANRSWAHEGVSDEESLRP